MHKRPNMPSMPSKPVCLICPKYPGSLACPVCPVFSACPACPVRSACPVLMPSRMGKLPIQENVACLLLLLLFIIMYYKSIYWNGTQALPKKACITDTMLLTTVLRTIISNSTCSGTGQTPIRGEFIAFIYNKQYFIMFTVKITKKIIMDLKMFELYGNVILKLIVFWWFLEPLWCSLWSSWKLENQIWPSKIDILGPWDNVTMLLRVKKSFQNIEDFFA